MIQDTLTPIQTTLQPSSLKLRVKDEVYDPELESLVGELLARVGEDPSRDGLQRTPLRVTKSIDFFTSGYSNSFEEVVNNAIFIDSTEEMVVDRDIEFYSLCEHHMLPFFGKEHVGYLPNGKIIRLSTKSPAS